MKIGESSNNNPTQSRDNPKDSVVSHRRTMSVTTEFEINYEQWAGDLTVPLHVYVSKYGILVHGQRSPMGPEIQIDWAQLDEMRAELGVPHGS